MSSYYYRSGLSERLKSLYRQLPKSFYVYVIRIEEDNICKIGRTKRLLFRLRNLRAAIYRDHTIHIIRCTSSQESLALEKHIHKQFASQRLVREWFRGVSIKDVEALLISEYAHLMLESHDSSAPANPYRAAAAIPPPTSFDVALI